MGEAVFDRIARFYDYEQGNFTKDIPFYGEYAKECKGEVLELACGTGRILIPIAKDGVTITGIDISEEMLKTAKQKTDVLDKSIKQNIKLIRGDMSVFNLKKRFSLIFIAFRSFQSLVTRKKQSQCLECVREHLKNSGTFILDLFAPRHDLLAQVNRSVYLGEFYDRENDVYMTRRAEDEYNLADQTLKEDRFYEWTDKQGIFHQQRWSFELSYLFRYEAELLLEKHGLLIEHVFGDFDKSPYDYYSGEQIFVARKV
jgi:ubiquinone/menaquinone biosynthesis C-methylase UbiE